MTAPSAPGRFLFRLILVVIGLAMPGGAPLAPGHPAAETASTAPLRLAAALAIRADIPETPDAATPAPVPAVTDVARPDTAARSLGALASSIAVSLPGLPPRARGPPLG